MGLRAEEVTTTRLRAEFWGVWGSMGPVKRSRPRRWGRITRAPRPRRARGMVQSGTGQLVGGGGLVPADWSGPTGPRLIQYQ